MPLDTVTQGNQIRWDGNRRPFYEIYYLKFVDPHRQWSLWIRYTLLSSKLENKNPTASLWGIFCHQKSKTVAFKKTVSLTEVDIYHANRFIQIEDSYLALEKAYGALYDDHNSMSWDLSFEDPTHSLALYPHPFLYSLPFPKTKFVEPRLKSFVSGLFNINKQSYSVDRCEAHQAHIWGTQYAKRWVWGNCTSFQEDETALFEGLVAQIMLGPIESPPLALFYFMFEGERYEGNSLLQWVTNKSHHHLLEWHFEVISKNMKFVGAVKRDLSSIVGVEYEGPHGERRYCHNTMMADMELKVYQKFKKEWVPCKTLTSHKAAAFETVEPQPDTRVKFVL